MMDELPPVSTRVSEWTATRNLITRVRRITNGDQELVLTMKRSSSRGEEKLWWTYWGIAVYRKSLKRIELFQKYPDRK